VMPPNYLIGRQLGRKHTLRALDRLLFGNNVKDLSWPAAARDTFWHGDYLENPTRF
jgi:hypothetical protein